MRILAIFLAGFTAVSMLGCTGTEKGAGIGAVSGGVIGGVIGNNMGHNTGAGIAIGAVSGALLGGLIGNESDKAAQQQQPARRIINCPNNHQVDVTGFPQGAQVRCPVCNAIFPVS